jgi:membrane-bound metal-dependent hydrolase YbcI (DUF457 family)
MSTLVGHALAGAAVSATMRGPVAVERRRLLVALAIGSAILPDADAFLLLLGPRGAVVHRGLSHSLLFAAVVAGALTLAARRRLPPARTFALLFLAGVSHLALDYLMGAGPPVRPFAPFDERGWLAPVRLLPCAYYATSAGGLRNSAFWLLNAGAAALELAIVAPALIALSPARRARTRALAAALIVAGLATAFVLYN